MSNYYAQDSLVQGRQLKVQRLCIPFLITGNATPASVVISRDEPALLFLKTQGVDEISAVADGSPTLASATDSTGVFNLLIKLNEPCLKVMQAQVIGRAAALVKNCTLANTTGLTAAGDKIVLNCASAVDLTAGNLDGCLVVEYVTA